MTMRLLLLLAFSSVGFADAAAQTGEPVVMLFAGDVTLSDNVEKMIGFDSTYVFGLWKPGNEADIFMVNLEHPVTTAVERVVKKYNFKLDPAGLGTLKHGGVRLVNCANNHVFDYGMPGMEETMKHLKSAGIPFVGLGENLNNAREPVLFEIKGRRIGFLGYYGGGEYAATKAAPGFAPRVNSYILSDVKALRKKADYIVVNFHWGTERAPDPDPWQRTLARKVIDAGADLIVGHHPHVLQGIEEYRGKHIAYSLGNFVFGGNTQHTYETGVLKVTLDSTAHVELLPVSVRRWQPSPAVGEARERILQLVHERSRSFSNHSLNSEQTHEP